MSEMVAKRSVLYMGSIYTVVASGLIIVRLGLRRNFNIIPLCHIAHTRHMRKLRINQHSRCFVRVNCSKWSSLKSYLLYTFDDICMFSVGGEKRRGNTLYGKKILSVKMAGDRCIALVFFLRQHTIGLVFRYLYHSCS